MSNSKLAVWHYRGTNNKNPRNHKIDTITIHHQAGNGSFLGCATSVENRNGSCNYMIQSDGKIGVMVDEDYRSWCSSNPSNDHRAVTIEVANSCNASDGDKLGWPVSDKALSSLINLCVDICKRNGIKKLNYTGDTSGNLTMHKWFAPTGCPGPYLSSKFPYIAEQVNKRLAPKPATVTIKPKYTHTKKAIRINWHKVKGASGYRVYRYNAKTKKWDTLKTIGNANTTTYRDGNTLSPNTEYKYKVKAYVRVDGKAVWGEASKVFKAKTKK